MKCFRSVRGLEAAAVLSLAISLPVAAGTRADLDAVRRLQHEGKPRTAVSLAFAVLRAAPQNSRALGLQEQSVAVLRNNKAKTLRRRADEILEKARKRQGRSDGAQTLCRAAAAAHASGAHEAAKAYFQEAAELDPAIPCTKEGSSRARERVKKPNPETMKSRPKPLEHRARRESPRRNSAPVVVPAIVPAVLTTPTVPAAPVVLTTPIVPATPAVQADLVVPTPQAVPAPASVGADRLGTPKRNNDPESAAVAYDLYLRGLAAYMRGNRGQARRLIQLAADRAEDDSRYHRLLERMDRETRWIGP